MRYISNTMFCFCILLISCTPMNKADQSSTLLEDRVFVAKIVADSNALKEYLQYHQSVWPEVEAGFKKAGYKKIVLYRFNHLLVMTITVPRNADLNAMGKLAESYSPRCMEWNKIMNSYQTGVDGAAAGQTWVEVNPFYLFDNR